jgi:hypothetical protein
MEAIGNLIRYWVHYDNTLTALNKQAKTVRDTRNNYEAQILQAFKAANLTNPIVQIAGGRLTVGEERHTQPLSYKNLELMLHLYYRQRPGSRDETADILKFIKAERTSESTACLRRSHTGRSRSKDSEQS